MTGVPIGARALMLSEGTPKDSNNLLLLHCDGTNGSTSFPDSALISNTVTSNGGAAVSTATVKFGTGALGLGLSKYLTIPNSAFNFGSGNFTIDFWFNAAAAPGGNYYMISKGGSSVSYASGFVIYVPSLSPAVYVSSTGSSWDMVSGLAFGALSANTWYHMALVRNGSSFSAYLNGSNTGNASSGGSIFSNSNALAIGDPGGTPNVSHFIDEFRVSKNARWVAPFTPPTAPYI